MFLWRRRPRRCCFSITATPALVVDSGDFPSSPSIPYHPNRSQFRVDFSDSTSSRRRDVAPLRLQTESLDTIKATPASNLAMLFPITAIPAIPAISLPSLSIPDHPY